MSFPLPRGVATRITRLTLAVRQMSQTLLIWYWA